MSRFFCLVCLLGCMQFSGVANASLIVTGVFSFSFDSSGPDFQGEPELSGRFSVGVDPVAISATGLSGFSDTKCHWCVYC
ncbi:MAG: hypothetical protein AAFY29_02025 [Pseudomonadota bacterium]